jgi:RHS repeat-associated protein
VDGELVAEYGGAGTSGSAKPEYVLTETLGSTRAKTNGEGQVVARFDYEPFGGEVGRNGSAGDGLRQRFTGKERDGESGLDYFGARYFLGAQGRFTSPDPLSASRKASNPQTWNRYTYALKNPLKFVDPDGLEVPDSCVKDPTCTIVIRLTTTRNS